MEKINLNFPFAKVDKVNRIVTGIATADNVDQGGDVVEYEASEKAFQAWVGNIREMHGKEAVGKAVNFSPTTVTKDGQTYRGIEVSAYISKGAPNTWEKVLDHTLSGFSIGGDVEEKAFEFDKATGKNVRRITKYTLGELSLVDNPMNPVAMFSMVKRAEDGTLEVETFDKAKHVIYYCENDKVAKADSKECTHCDETMTEIGYSEDFDLETVEKMIKDFMMEKMTEAIEKEGGAGAASPGHDDSCDGSVDLAKGATCPSCGYVMKAKVTDDEKEDAADDGADEALEDKKKVSKSLQNNNSNDSVGDMDLTDTQKIGLFKKFWGVITGDDITEMALEKAVVAEEVAADEVEEVIEASTDEKIEKGGSEEMDMNTLKEALGSILDEKLTAHTEEINKSVDAKIAEMNETISKSVEAVTETVEKIDEKTAIKKSVDETDEVDESEKVEKATESFWGGIFVPTEVAQYLGYDS